MASETIADIVAEYRRDYEDMKAKRLYMPTAEYLRRLLDRIEEAAKREEQCYLDQIRDAMNQWGHEKYKAEHAPVGNMAAMREALKVANETADQLLKWIWNHYQELNCMGSRLKRAVEAALAAPPRNCDVGSPQEQADRHRELCLKYGGCSTCPRNKDEWSYKDCILDWEQLPYEGGAK